jgi:hypothetical protein
LSRMSSRDGKKCMGIGLRDRPPHAAKATSLV